MRTLLADDNGEIRAALRLLLEELGEADVLEAGDLDQALAALEPAGVDVVLLDWELPEGDYVGGSTAEFVRESKQRAPGCRMIAMSGRPESRGESLRAGCDAFVSKNDPPDQLLALLGVARCDYGVPPNRPAKD
jgi:two-component system invasion response regulator UvrY